MVVELLDLLRDAFERAQLIDELLFSKSGQVGSTRRKRKVVCLRHPNDVIWDCYGNAEAPVGKIIPFFFQGRATSHVRNEKLQVLVVEDGFSRSSERVVLRTAAAQRPEYSGRGRDIGSHEFCEEPSALDLNICPSGNNAADNRGGRWAVLNVSDTEGGFGVTGCL